MSYSLARHEPSSLKICEWALNAYATYRVWRRRTEERRHLAEMTDREFHDIGITRADAMAEINKPFWR